MDIIHCHCAGCGAEFNVRSQYAGKRVRCVKCGQAVAVARPVHARPAPSESGSVAAPEQVPAAVAEESLSDILGLTSPAGSGATDAHARREATPRRRSTSVQIWCIAVPVGAVLLVAGLLLGVVISGLNSRPTEPASAPTKTTSTAASETTGKSAERQFSIVAPPTTYVVPTFEDKTSSAEEFGEPDEQDEP